MAKTQDEIQRLIREERARMQAAPAQAPPSVSAMIAEERARLQKEATRPPESIRRPPPASIAKIHPVPLPSPEPTLGQRVGRIGGALVAGIRDAGPAPLAQGRDIGQVTPPPRPSPFDIPEPAPMQAPTTATGAERRQRPSEILARTRGAGMVDAGMAPTATGADIALGRPAAGRDPRLPEASPTGAEIRARPGQILAKVHAPPEPMLADATRVDPSAGQGIEPGFVSGFGHGLKSAASVTMPSLAGHTLQEFGMERLGGRLIEGADRRAQASDYKAPMVTEDGVSGEWVGHSIGQSLPTTLPGIVGGTIGGMLGAPLGPLGVAGGAALGAAIPSYLMGIGDIRQELIDAGADDDVLRRVLVRGGAIPYAMLESLLPGKVGKVFLRGAVKNLIQTGKATAMGAVTEGITESLQSVLSQGAANIHTGRPVDWRQALEEGAAGAVGGGAMSGAAHVVAKPEMSKEQREALQDLLRAEQDGNGEAFAQAAERLVAASPEEVAALQEEAQQASAPQQPLGAPAAEGAAPRPVPDRVRARVTRALNDLREANTRVETSREADRISGAAGRYESEALAAVAEARERAEETVKNFRTRAEALGIDAEAFLQELGGVPGAVAGSEAAADWAAAGERRAEREGRPEAANSAGDIAAAFGDMGAGISDGLTDRLWESVQAGETKEAGQESTLLQAAKVIRDAGGLQTRDDVAKFSREYGAIERNADFIPNVRALVGRWEPGQSAAPRAETGPVTPGAPQARPVDAPAAPLTMTGDGVDGTDLGVIGEAQYALTKDGQVMRRRADEAGTYGGWRWQADAEHVQRTRASLPDMEAIAAAIDRTQAPQATEQQPAPAQPQMPERQKRAAEIMAKRKAQSAKTAPEAPPPATAADADRIAEAVQIAPGARFRLGYEEGRAGSELRGDERNASYRVAHQIGARERQIAGATTEDELAEMHSAIKTSAFISGPVRDHLLKVAATRLDEITGATPAAAKPADPAAPLLSLAEINEHLDHIVRKPNATELVKAFIEQQIESAERPARLRAWLKSRERVLGRHQAMPLEALAAGWEKESAPTPAPASNPALAEARDRGLGSVGQDDFVKGAEAAKAPDAKRPTASYSDAYRSGFLWQEKQQGTKAPSVVIPDVPWGEPAKAAVAAPAPATTPVPKVTGTLTKLRGSDERVGQWAVPKSHRGSISDANALAAYFTPGQTVVAWGNQRDRVLAFEPQNKMGTFSVTVQRVDADGNLTEQPRMHSTTPRRQEFEQLMRERGWWPTGPKVTQVVSPDIARSDGEAAFKRGESNEVPPQYETKREQSAWEAGWKSAQLAAPKAAPTDAATAPLEGHGERTRRVKWEKGRVTPTRDGVATSKPAVTIEETYADGTEVVRGEDGSVISKVNPYVEAAKKALERTDLTPKQATAALDEALKGLPEQHREGVLRQARFGDETPEQQSDRVKKTLDTFFGKDDAPAAPPARAPEAKAPAPALKKDIPPRTPSGKALVNDLVDRHWKNDSDATAELKRIGTVLVPGIRRQDAEDAAIVYYVGTMEEFGAWVEEARKSNKISAPGAAVAAEETKAPAKAPEGKVAAAPLPADFGANNKVFTKEVADAALDVLRKKLSQLNTGVDLEMLNAGIQRGGFYVEGGIRKFADVASRFASDLGVSVAQLRPYLRGWYNGLRDTMEDQGMSIEGMDDADAVRVALDAIGAEAEAKSAETTTEDRDGEAGTTTADGAPALEEDRGGLPESEGPGVVQGAQAGGRPGRVPGQDGGGSKSGVRAPGGKDTAPEPGSGKLGDAGSTGVDNEGRNRPDGLSEPTAATEPGRAQGNDYKIQPGDLSNYGTPMERARANVEAIRIVKLLDREGRPATADEQKKLVRFVGWGGLQEIFPDPRSRWGRDDWRSPGWATLGRELKEILTEDEYATARGSTQNAHYTSEGVINAVYGALKRLGVTGPVRALEPGAGAGHFIGLDQLGATWTTVEKDVLTSGILHALYPNQGHYTAPYEKVTLADKLYDLIIGNPPFGAAGIHDKRYGRINLKIHDYFFVKSLDKLRPGGILAFVTSTGTLDKAGRGARQRMADRADFLGAVRLPSTAFEENAATSVTTDILFFRRREDGVAPNHVAPWMALKEDPVHGFKINEYFIDNPGQMLGELGRDTLHVGRAALYQRPGAAPMLEQLEAAFSKLPEGVYTPARASMPRPKEQTFGNAPAGARMGQYIVKGGNVLQVTGSGLAPVLPTNTPAGKRVAALVKIGELTRAVLDASRTNAPDAELVAAQKQLGKAYDAFVNEHGPINKQTVTVNKKGQESTRRPNLDRYNDPVNGPLVAALERYNPETDTAVKSDWFTKRMHAPISRPESTDTAWGAVVASLVEFGRVEVPYAAKLYGKPEKQLLKELEGRVFRDPQTGLYQTADIYLSGNVREKLALAKEAVESDASFKINVEALTKAQPKDITIGQMKRMLATRVGVTWITTDTYTAFAYDVLGQGASINYRQVDGKYSLSQGQIFSPAENKDWGTSRETALSLFRDMLNGNATLVYDVEEDGEGKKVKVLNKKDSELAELKKEQIQRRFERWMLDDDVVRAEQAVQRYNELMNHTVLPVWDGEHLRGNMPGVASNLRGRPFTPAPHQLAAVWRHLVSGNMLLAHEVGAGKTFAMIMAGMEAKRLGLARKPIYVVPNSMLGQFSQEFLELYPDAKILVADEYQFHGSRRTEFLARVAADNWDGVIITHDSIKAIPTTPEFQREMIQRMLDEYVEAITIARADTKGSFTTKALEKARDMYQAKLDALTDVRKDNTLYWEDLGVDLLFLDEAHEYKNLSLPSNTSVPLSSAQKTTDMYIKTRYIERVNPGRGLVFATATPISNSIAEQYVMLRYLNEDGLRAAGYPSFDSWSRDYVQFSAAQEYTAIGTLEMKTRARAYVNTFAMAQGFRSIADVKLAKDLNLDTPTVIGDNVPMFGSAGDVDAAIADGGSMGPMLVVVPGSSRLKRFMTSLQKRWDSKPGKPQKGDDSVFPIINDGRFGAIDARMVTGQHAQAHGHDSSQPWLHSKARYVTDRAFAVWEDSKHVRGTQMIFSDLGVPKEFRKSEVAAVEAQVRKESPDATDAEVAEAVEAVLGSDGYDLYSDIKRMLVEKGVPESEIAFIQEARGNKKKKQAIIERMKRGDIRILIGSTQMMGQGVNAQERMVALHHIDVPYKPAWLQQREGRVVRQGNVLWEKGEILGVRIFRYALKGSYDPRAWQILENKIGFIQQGMTADADTGTVEETGGQTLSASDAYAIIKAEASDNPHGMDHAVAGARVKSLEYEKQEHADKEFAYRLSVKYAQDVAGRLSSNLWQERADAKIAARRDGESFSISVGGKAYTDREKAGEAIIKAVNAIPKRQRDDKHDIGAYGGLTLRVGFYHGDDVYFFLRGQSQPLNFGMGWASNGADVSPIGLTQRIDTLRDRVIGRPELTSQDIAKLKAEAEATQALIGKPFPNEDKLAAARAELADLQAKMDEYSGKSKFWGTLPEPEGGWNPHDKFMEHIEAARTIQELDEVESKIPDPNENGGLFLASQNSARRRLSERRSEMEAAEAAAAPDALTKAEADARARIFARRSGKLRSFPGFEPGDIVDYGIIGAVKIIRGTRTVKRWSRSMVTDFGTGIKPHLAEIRKVALKIARGAPIKRELAALPAERRERAEAAIADIAAGRPVRPGDVGLRRQRSNERLVRKYQRVTSLVDRFSAVDKVSADLFARAERTILNALGPTPAQKVLLEIRAATTPAEALKAVQRAQQLMENELHRRAVADLQRELKRAANMKMRPEFIQHMGVTVAEIDVSRMGAAVRKMLQAAARALAENPQIPVRPETKAAMQRPANLRSMSFEEVRDITDAVRAVIHMNRTKNRMIGAARKETRDAVSADIISEAKARVKKLVRGKVGDLETRPRRGKVGVFLKEFSVRPEVLVEHLSPTLQKLFYEDLVIEAHHVQEKRIHQLRDALAAAIEKAGHKNQTAAFDKWRQGALTLETLDGPVQISRDEAIAMLGAFRDPHNLSRAYKHGITIGRSDRPFRFDDDTLASLNSIVGDGERIIAAELFRQFNGPMKKMLNDAWVEVYGFEVAKVPQYWPSSIDVTRTDLQTDPLEKLAEFGMPTLTSWTHLNERTGIKGSLLIGSGLDTYMNHAEHVARISAYLAPATNFHAIVGRVDVQQTIRQRVGREGYNRLIEAVNAQTIRHQDKTDGEREVRKFLRKASVSVLALRVTTMLLNPTGLPISASYQKDGFKNLARAMGTGFSPGEWKRITEMATEYSPYWRTRYESFAHQAQSGMDTQQYSYGRPPIEELGMKPLEMSDRFGAVIRWKMAEHHVAATMPELKAGGEAHGNAVGREWERLMFRGENTGHGGDMTGALAYGRDNVWFGAFVRFMSSVSKIYSVGVRGALQFQRGEYAAAKNSLAALLASSAMAAMVREMVTSMKGDDDEDEGIPERIALRVATEAAGYLPILGSSVVAPAVRVMAGKPTYIYPSSMTEGALIDTGETTLALFRAIKAGLDGDDAAFRRHGGRAFQGSLELVALWTGAPYGGPRDIMKMLENAAGPSAANARPPRPSPPKRPSRPTGP